MQDLALGRAECCEWDAPYAIVDLLSLTHPRTGVWTGFGKVPGSKARTISPCRAPACDVTVGFLSHNLQLGPASISCILLSTKMPNTLVSVPSSQFWDFCQWWIKEKASTENWGPCNVLGCQAYRVPQERGWERRMENWWNGYWRGKVCARRKILLHRNHHYFLHPKYHMPCAMRSRWLTACIVARL
jgi:hypothetical protein